MTKFKNGIQDTEAFFNEIGDSLSIYFGEFNKIATLKDGKKFVQKNLTILLDEINNKLEKLFFIAESHKDKDFEKTEYNKIKEYFSSQWENDYLKNIVNSFVSIIIILHKQRVLKDFNFSPKNFLSNFFFDIFPFFDKDIVLKDDSFENRDAYLKEKFISSLSKIVDWNKLREFKNEINLLNWDQLKIFQTEMTIIESTKVFINSKSGNYQNYLKKVHKELQDRSNQPDLVLMDTIFVDEYLEKGIFESVGSYIKDGDIDENMMQFGRTLNGRIDTIPVSRNFHLVACDSFFNVKGFVSLLKKQTAEIAKEGDVEKNRKYKLNDSETAQIEFETFLNWNDTLIKAHKDSIENRNGNDNLSFLTPQIEFILFLKNGIPYIPMQAARGPHIGYTAFAYFSGYAGEGGGSLNLVDVEKSEDDKNVVSILSQAILFKAAKAFFKCVYLFVPFISLCTDHSISSKLRGFSRKFWFDPCLPIEAECFDNEEKSQILFSNYPCIGESRTSMSCIGGYCLALSSDSYSKETAIKVALKLSKLGKEPENEAIIKNRKTGNFRIIDGEKPEFYNMIPLDYSYRPSFYGWGQIENAVSDVFHLFIATVIISRSIIEECEFIKKNRDNEKLTTKFFDEYIKYNSTISKKEDFLKKLNSPPDAPEYNIILDVLNETALDHFLKISCETISKWLSTQNIFENQLLLDNWINANLNPIKFEIFNILGLLKTGYKKIKDNGKLTKEEKLDELLNFLSEEFANKLNEKISILCSLNDWSFKK